MNPEETKNEETKTEPEKKNDNPTPPIDMDRYIASARDAALAAVKDKLDSAEKKVSEIERLSQEQQKRLIAALTGKNDEPEIDPLTLKLLTNTEDVLNTYGEVLMDKVLGRIADTATQAKGTQEAAREILAERPDIARSKTAQAFIEREFRNDKSDKSPKEKFKEAVRSFDLLMEDHDLGSVEERIKRAQSVPSGAASAPSKAPRENSVEAGKRYLESRQKHWRQTRGLET